MRKRTEEQGEISPKTAYRLMIPRFFKGIKKINKIVLEEENMLKVKKRDGQLVEFNINKIEVAIEKAFNAKGIAHTEDVISMLALKVAANFAAKVKEVYGYEPIVVNGNTEYELESGEILSRDEVLREALDQEDIENLKNKLSSIKGELETVIASAQNAVSDEISLQKLTQINNIVQELEKASLNLGASVLAEDRDETPLSEKEKLK